MSHAEEDRAPGIRVGELKEESRTRAPVTDAARFPPMDPARWAQARELFEAGLERNPAEREEFLAGACADLALRQCVQELLASHEEAGDFLQRPAGRPSPDVTPGHRVGAWRLVREIGQGGMGSVWLAERADDQFEQRAALKLVKAGMDSDLILERFRSERQILAGLEHPYVARLLDGGTTESGRPYLAMEYVEGQPITHWCASRGLGITARLELFRRVCQAVQYAHQRLVVHRDLKPSNILVTSDGTPKLLDFGIAKMLSGDALQTSVQERLMTPAYASPEQIQGGPITTACDVYALGVLLYELLTGRRPYRLTGNSAEEVARAVVAQEPTRASQAAIAAGDAAGGGPARLARQLRGDLDTILGMALRKEPSRRYASAEALSEDLRLHLAGLPVLAREDTLRYRASKFVRRNLAGVGAALLVLVALTAGLVSTSVQRARAEHRFAQVRRLAHAVLFDYQDAVEALPGSTPVRERMVKDALAYLDSLAGEASDDRSLQEELAAAYERVGRIQGNSYFSNLGDTRGALLSYAKSLAIRERLAAEQPSERPAKRALARSLEGYGDVQWTANDLRAASDSYARAAQILEGLAKDDPSDLQLRGDLATFYVSIADLYGNPGYANLGDTRAALQHLNRSLALRQEVDAAGRPEDRGPLAESLYHMGEMQRATGDVKEALRTFERARAAYEEMAAAEPNSVEPRRLLAGVHRYLGALLEAQGEGAVALEHHNHALSISEALARADITNVKRQRELCVSLRGRAGLLARRGAAAASLRDADRALRTCGSLEQSGGANADNRRLLLTLRQQLAESLLAAGRARDALPHARAALDLADALLVLDKRNTLGRSDRAGALVVLGQVHWALAERDGAVGRLLEAVSLRKALAGSDPANALAREDLERAERLLLAAQRP